MTTCHAQGGTYSQLDDGNKVHNSILLEAYSKPLMEILQIKFMRHTEPQETNIIKSTFFLYTMEIIGIMV